MIVELSAKVRTSVRVTSELIDRHLSSYLNGGSFYKKECWK